MPRPLVALALLAGLGTARAADWWPAAVVAQLAKAGANCGELVKALDGVPAAERPGMAFIVANMPDADLTTLSGEFLLSNHRLAYRARREMPWGNAIPEELFLNDVLPYANVDEKRDPWRAEFSELCAPIVKGCETPGEAALKLNRELFAKLGLKYAPQRGAPNDSPAKSIARKNASFTGLSIALADACAGGPHTAQVVDVVADSPSSWALMGLPGALAAKPKTLGELACRDFMKWPLTRADAAAARKLLRDAHRVIVRAARAAEVKSRVRTDGELKMPFAYTTFGDKPAAGHSLWISLHGGGNTTPAVNDKQWKNQQSLYKLSEGIYLAPRAPTNSWNLWHEPHIGRLLARLIEDFIVLEGVDPDRVYLLGYSAGGDGVYQLAPRLAEHWAAAVMAGHPNGIPLESLRNVPFALQVGADDAAYKRNEVAREYGDRLDSLQKGDPDGYARLTKIHAGKPHGMGGDDKLALPWMAKFRRDPVPRRVVWHQSGVLQSSSYWLAVPPGAAKLGARVAAPRDGQRIDITEAEGVERLLIRLDDRVTNLDKAVVVTRGGRESYRGVPARTTGARLETLAARGDPGLIFDAEIAVPLIDSTPNGD